MERIKTSFYNQDLTKERQEVLDRVKESKIFDQFIKDNKISDQEILSNASKFLRVLEEKKSCEKCQGLDKCQKSSQGRHLELKIDNNGEIDLGVSLCSESAKQLKLQNLFLYRDFSDEWPNLELKDFSKNSDYWPKRQNIILYLKNIITKKETKGIYIAGTRQSGKTFILVAFAKIIAEKNNLKIAFLNSSKRVKELNDLYFLDKEEFSHQMQELEMVDVLILDDFGNEYKNEIIRDMIVFPLLNERLKSKKITCFTSAYKINEIVSMYSLKEMNSPKAEQLEEIIKLLTKQFYLDSLPYRE